jgi:hypothetical protein
MTKIKVHKVDAKTGAEWDEEEEYNPLSAPSDWRAIRAAEKAAFSGLTDSQKIQKLAEKVGLA